MLISIITPSFNQAEFIEHTILSVLNQSYKNVEYIIMDGGSTDGSVDIIKKYSDRISYWQSKPDGGQVKAINEGFKRSKGDIIAYLNSDDVLTPDAIETIVRAYEVNPDYAVYFGLCNTINEHGYETEKPNGNNIQGKSLLKNGMLPNIYQPACFFNKKKIDREKFLNEKYTMAFDYELLLFLIKKGSFLFLYHHFASYRLHQNNKSTTHKKQHYLEKISIQENYSKKYWLLWKYRRLKFAAAIMLGKV